MHSPLLTWAQIERQLRREWGREASEDQLSKRRALWSTLILQHWCQTLNQSAQREREREWACRTTTTTTSSRIEEGSRSRSRSSSGSILSGWSSAASIVSLVWRPSSFRGERAKEHCSRSSTVTPSHHLLKKAFSASPSLPLLFDIVHSSSLNLKRCHSTLNRPPAAAPRAPLLPTLLRVCNKKIIVNNNSYFYDDISSLYSIRRSDVRESPFTVCVQLFLLFLLCLLTGADARALPSSLSTHTLYSLPASLWTLVDRKVARIVKVCLSSEHPRHPPVLRPSPTNHLHQLLHSTFTTFQSPIYVLFKLRL